MFLSEQAKILKNLLNDPSQWKSAPFGKWQNETYGITLYLTNNDDICDASYSGVEGSYNIPLTMLDKIFLSKIVKKIIEKI